MCNCGCSEPSPPASSAPVASPIRTCPLAQSEVLLVDEIGLPFSNTAVKIHMSSGGSFDATTDSNGKICLSSPPGTTGRIELVNTHEAETGDSTNTASGQHFSAGGTGP